MIALNINEAQWRAMVADFRKTLDKFEVPTKEQEELITIVGGTKKDIVKPASVLTRSAGRAVTAATRMRSPGTRGDN
jgi:hypothetical protein